MSARTAKKKRIGSRRQLPNQSKTDETDEFHVTDSTSVAQSHIPEENTESLNVLAYPENSQSETHRPPSPELTGNRRKLGSSRRNKRGQYVKESATESYHEDREEVEENVRCNETPETTQMSLAVHPERQEKLSQGSEHDIMSTTPDSSLYLATTPDFTNEVQSLTKTNHPEADLESLIPKSENLQADKDEYEMDCKVMSDSCKLEETKQQGIDKSDTRQYEEVKENAHLAGIFELTGVSVLSYPTVDPQLIDQSNFREMPEKELPNEYSVTEKVRKERNDDTELLRHDGNLQGSYVVSESHIESAVIQFSITPEVTTDESSPKEDTEADFSSPKQDLPTDEEQKDIFNLSTVRGAHQSEDALKKVHELEFEPTQMQETDYFSESVIHDATENFEIISASLMDQPEVSNTHQSELIVKSTNDSATKQEDSNPDDKHDDHPTKENNFEALDYRNEDYHVHDTNKPQISDMERVDTALGQVYEGEGRVEDDIKPSAEQTGHRAQEGLFSEIEESESLQTLQSEIHTPLDSQPQQTDTGFNPIGNRRKLGSSRRNKGRQHAKDSVAESYHRHTEEVAGNTIDNEPLEEIQMSLTVETTVQEKSMETMLEEINTSNTAKTEEVSDQVKENAHVDTLVGISELNSSILYPSLTVDQQLINQSNSTEMPEEELPSAYSEKENEERDEDTELLRSDGNLQDNYLGSESPLKSEDIESEISTDKHSLREHTEHECSVEQADFSSPKQDLPTDEEQNEIFILSTVRGGHQSEDAVNKVHEQEFEPTQMQETDYSSESMTHDATENPVIISGNLIDQADISDTYQSELIGKSTNDSATKQEDSNPDDKHDDHPTKENNFEALDHRNEDYHVYDTEKPQISNVERVDTALGQVYEGGGRVEDDIKPSAEQTGHQEEVGLFSETEESESSLQTLQPEIHTPLDSQPQQTDTGFNPIGNRRKLGSSRRNKGRQHTKDSVAESYHRHTEEVAGNTIDNEPLEEIQMSLTVETTVQEKSMETMLEEINTDTAKTEEVSDQVKENAHVDTLVGKLTSLHSSLTVDQQLINQSNSTEMPEEELPNVYSETEKENEERDEVAELLKLDRNLQDIILVSESHLKSEDKEYSITQEITTEKSSPGEHTEAECGVEQAELKEELTPNEEQKEHVNLSHVRGARHSENVVNEEEVKPIQMQERPQMDYSSVKESKSSLQTLKSEMNASLDSQLLDNSQGIKEQTHAGFKSTGNRRKLGSSRRNKGRQHVCVTETYNEPEEDFVENTRGDEVLETTKMSLGTAMRQEELKEQIDLDLKPAKEIRKIGSTVNVKEKTPEEDTILSHNVMDNSTIVTTNSTSRSGKDDFVKSSKDVTEEGKNFMKEPKNSSELTRDDTVKMDSIQWKDDSDIQNISYHDDNVTSRSIALNVLEQEEAFLVQNTEALYCDKDSQRQEMNMQQTNDAIETVEDVAIKDYNTEAESLIIVQVSGQDEIGKRFEDPTKKDSEAQEMNASQEISHAAQNKTDTLVPFDIGVKENFKAEPAVDMSEESGIFTAVGACNTQQGIQDKTDLDNSENLRGKSKQKRRKMGSTRQRKPEGGIDNKNETRESDFNIEADMRNLEKVEEVEELPMIVTAEVSQNENASPMYKEQQETKQTSIFHNKGQKLQSSASDPQSIQSNMMSDIDDLKALLPEQSASHNEEAVNPVTSVHVAEVRDSERNVTSHLDQKLDSNTEDATNSGITGGSFVSLRESTQNDEERPESVKVIQDQALKSVEAPVVAVADLEIVQSVVRGGAGEEHKNVQACIQEPCNVNEVYYDKNIEMKNASPNLNSTNRRRKMGSTRRNLSSQTKGEDLHQKQLVDNEATEITTNAGDVKTESFSGIKEKELQFQIEHDSDSEQRKEKVFETVEYSHTGSHFKPPAHQTFEENLVSHGKLVETEHQLPPSYLPAIPSISPKHDVMSESASGRRRRKMGSHRKSHGHQNIENQTARGDRITDTQNGRDVRSITDESAVKTTEEESLGLDKILEVDESYKKASSSISTSKAGKHSRPVSEKTPEHQKTFSLGNSRGADLKSNGYNVIMVGDSSVGKTSFMKRAQSGKFSLDIPISVGLDSCMWTVVVDGKPVVLQLWDTAGQERFHSITRQIFHKAQAFLLMYDITSSQSFSAISYWADCIQEGAAENVTILLIGNKSDHAERQVKTQQGEILAKEYNFEFMECSAATGENVIHSLETIARMLSQKVATREEAMVLHKEPQQKKSSGCC
ncbi:extracellular matrix-binding protein ebh isoform X2 [Siniperca chuatsi]|uniref:extracellular matrix-binding protein ebh isoform X2 n=1 Tax=Siniperca chuatsi TaxID=119488 RepID=UPI001CE0772E|nr:extracellular matrix-binding protein ebh isoform X2 [Siniperca chuatsi]